MNYFCPEIRPLDMLCLGRAGMDMYAEQGGVALESVTHFAKSLGGSPANIAVGMSRLDKQVGLISVVSDDGIGRDVKAMLNAEKVDISSVVTKSNGCRTSLAVAEQRVEGCEVVIYRNQAADLLLSIDDLNHEKITGSRALLISGTALSQSPSREAALYAIQIARLAGTTVVLDLDYRPYSWPSVAEAAVYYRMAAEMSDVIFGNREEFEVLRTGLDFEGAVEQWLLSQPVVKLIFLKDGANGSVALDKEGLRIKQVPFVVEAKKPYGAGDAYAAAICSSLLSDLSLDRALERGAAAAAMVVAAQHCGLSSPDTVTLNDFISSHKPRSVTHA